MLVSLLPADHDPEQSQPAAGSSDLLAKKAPQPVGGLACDE
jgi:hypothetical protein